MTGSIGNKKAHLTDVPEEQMTELADAWREASSDVVRVGKRLLLFFQEPWLWALRSRKPMQTDCPLPPSPADWPRNTHHTLHLPCCVCALAVLSLEPLHWLWAPRGQGTCLSESPLYQQCLAHSLRYRRYLMNIWMNSQNVIICSTLSCKRELLRFKLTASFPHRWEPRAAVLPVKWRGCGKTVCQRSLSPWLLCRAVAERPVAQGSHLHQESHHPALSYSLSRPRSYCYQGNCRGMQGI